MSAKRAFVKAGRVRMPNGEGLDARRHYIHKRQEEKKLLKILGVPQEPLKTKRAFYIISMGLI
jgi:hypothetical protein